MRRGTEQTRRTRLAGLAKGLQSYDDPHHPYSPPTEYGRAFLQDLASEEVESDPYARECALYDAEIRYTDHNLGHLFDLGADPGESANLVESRPDRAAAMEATLLRYLESLPAPRAPGPEGEVNAETREALRGLGYIE